MRIIDSTTPLMILAATSPRLSRRSKHLHLSPNVLQHRQFRARSRPRSEAQFHAAPLASSKKVEGHYVT
jgi:hypothetical protein